MIDGITRRCLRSGIAGKPAYSRVKFLICIRIVCRRSIIDQVMPVDQIEQIKVSVLVKVWMQCKTKQSVIPIGSDLFRDIDKELLLTILYDPCPATPFPNKHFSTIFAKCQTD